MTVGDKVVTKHSEQPMEIVQELSKGVYLCRTVAGVIMKMYEHELIKMGDKAYA